MSRFWIARNNNFGGTDAGYVATKTKPVKCKCRICLKDGDIAWLENLCECECGSEMSTSDLYPGHYLCPHGMASLLPARFLLKPGKGPILVSLNFIRKG